MEVCTENGSSTLRYMRVRNDLGLLISDGQFEVGERLPPVRELATRFGVSYLTMRQALSLLESDGIVANFPRKGVVLVGREPSLESNSSSDSPPCEAGTSNCIALVIADAVVTGCSDLTSANLAAYSNAEFRSIDRHLRTYNHSLVLTHIDAADLLNNNLPPVLSDGSVAGIILDGFVNDYHIAYFSERGHRIVVNGNAPISLPVSQVRIDFEKAAYLLTRALLDLGVGPVHFSTFPLNLNYAHEALAGYIQAVGEVGQVAQVHAFTTSGRDDEELELMLKGADGPFALLLMNEEVILHLHRLYQERGWLPGDHPVAVLGGCEGLSSEVISTYNVTSINIDNTCKLAVDLLEDIIAGGEPRSVVLEPELSVSSDNGSTGLTIKWELK